MERKVQNRVLDNIIIVVDSMEIVQSCLFYRNVVSVSFDGVKVWHSQCKDIQNTWFQQVLILVFDTGLGRIEEG